MAAYTVTYSSLIAELQDICEDTNAQFVTELPLIIARAQDTIMRDLKLGMWTTFVRTNLNDGNAYLYRDPSWLTVQTMHFPDLVAFPEQRSVDWCRLFGRVKGVPKYWCEVDSNRYQFAPTPVGNITVELEIVARLPALSLANQTNYLTTHLADLLLLASLFGCHAYLKNGESMASTGGLYNELLGNVRNELNASVDPSYATTRAASRPAVGA